MGLKQTILGRTGSTRVGWPDRAVSINGGSLGWINQFFNYRGDPVYDIAGNQINPIFPPNPFVWNLVWGVPIANGGAGSVFTVNSETVNSYDIFNSSPNFPPSNGFVENSVGQGNPATMVFTGNGGNCNLNLVLTVVNPFPGPPFAFSGTLFSCQIIQDGVELTSVGYGVAATHNLPLNAGGIYDFPFTILPAANSVIKVSIHQTSSTFGPSNYGFQSIHAVGTLSVLP